MIGRRGGSVHGFCFVVVEYSFLATLTHFTGSVFLAQPGAS